MSLLNISKHVENIANVICLKATCSTRLQSKIRLYADDFIVFEQFFPHQLTQTASPSGADDIITSFPSFGIAKVDEGVGFAQWIGWFYENLNTASTATGTRIVDQHHRKTLVAPGVTFPQIAEWSDNTLLLGGVGGSGVNLVFDETGPNTATMSALRHLEQTSGYVERMAPFLWIPDFGRRLCYQFQVRGGD